MWMQSSSRFIKDDFLGAEKPQLEASATSSDRQWVPHLYRGYKPAADSETLGGGETTRGQTGNQDSRGRMDVKSR